MNPERSRGVCRADRVWWDSVVIEIAGFPVGRHVLAEERVATLDWWDSTEDLNLWWH